MGRSFSEVPNDNIVAITRESNENNETNKLDDSLATRLFEDSVSRAARIAIEAREFETFVLSAE